MGSSVWASYSSVTLIEQVEYATERMDWTQICLPTSEAKLMYIEQVLVLSRNLLPTVNSFLPNVITKLAEFIPELFRVVSDLI